MAQAESKGVFWGTLMPGFRMAGYALAAVGVTIVASAVGGYALTTLGGAISPAAGATAASWGGTISSLGAQLSGFSAWLAETVMWPFTKLMGAETATTVKTALEAGSSLDPAYVKAAGELAKTGADATKVIFPGADMAGTAARAGVGITAGLTGSAAIAAANSSDRSAQKAAIGKFTERVLQERELAQLVGQNRQV